jgi:hypothetical protein
MPRLTLAERLQRAGQKRIKAEQEEARLRTIQRKMRTRGLIEMGGLVVKAGLDELPPTALYAALLRIAAEVKNPETIALWEREGARHFQAEEDARIAAVARFPAIIERDLAAALRKLGFRWNRIVEQWEGKVDFTEAKQTVETAGGSIQPVRPGGPSAPRQGPTPG